MKIAIVDDLFLLLAYIIGFGVLMFIIYALWWLGRILLAAYRLYKGDSDL